MASTTLIKTDDGNFARDLHSKGLVATNKAALQQHRTMRARTVAQQQKILNLESRLNNLTQLVNSLALAK